MVSTVLAGYLISGGNCHESPAHRAWKTTQASHHPPNPSRHAEGQAVYPFDDPVALICNEEAKLEGLPLNRALRDENGNIYDIIAGTFFLCGAPPDSEDFTSLTDEQLAHYTNRFRFIEFYIPEVHT